MNILRRLPAVPDRLADAPDLAMALIKAGAITPVRPDRLAGMVSALLRYGRSVGSGYAAAAARHPDRIAVVDEIGSLTFREASAQAQSLALGLRELGVGEGDQVGVLLRNSRYLMLTLAACSHLGADVLLLNTGFSGPQATEVMRRHDARAVVHDEEFLPVVDEAAEGRLRVLGYVDTEVGPGAAGITELIERHAGRNIGGVDAEGKLVLLTSGTTGVPKGAARGGSNATAGLALLHRIPIRAGRTTLIASPVFHAWGLIGSGLALVLNNPLVLQRRFDPEQTLAAIERHRVDTVFAVPVMLQRMVDLPTEIIRAYDTSSLRVVAVSGSALPGDLAQRFMDRFGDVLYNAYGSTEVGNVTVAGPADMRAAPGTAGRPLPGVTLELLGDDDEPVAAGQVGRIFAGSGLAFTGYSGGGDKKRVRGLVSSGDLGRFDEDGRLFVTGRDDDMIISGGENVFPAEIEDLLAAEPEILEVAVVGVDDEKFGQRLSAFVVLREGAELGPDDVRARVKASLANYKVPRDVTFLAELPRNATGKVLKRQLIAHD